MKKFCSVLLMFFLLSNIASASGSNGDFEGNPIVAVQSNSQDLKVEDVPAIIYKGRTMVPIYLLKQLGADVVWDAKTYSVNVDLGKKANQEDSTAQERAMIKNAYGLLKDTDNAIWMFTMKLPQYSNLTYDYSKEIDEDYKNLLDVHTESLTYASEIAKNMKIENKITDIITNEIKTLDQIRQTRDMLTTLIHNNDPQIASGLKISMFNSFQKAQQNVLHTDRIVHDLLLQEMGMSKQPAP